MAKAYLGFSFDGSYLQQGRYPWLAVDIFSSKQRELTPLRPLDKALTPVRPSHEALPIEALWGHYMLITFKHLVY